MFIFLNRQVRTDKMIKMRLIANLHINQLIDTRIRNKYQITNSLELYTIKKEVNFDTSLYGPFSLIKIKVSPTV